MSGRPLVVKSASGAPRRMLRREAELLEQLKGPEVVRFVALRESDDRTDLVTEDAGRHSLSDHAGMPPAVLLRAVTAAAAALAALHDAGWVHGAVCSDHVVVDDIGRATWCSLASARPVAVDPAGIRADLAQFRSMVNGLASSRDPQWSFSEWRRFRSSVRTIVPFGSIAEPIDSTARPPGSDVHRPDGDLRPRRWSRSAIGLVVAVAAVGASALAWGAHDQAAGEPDRDLALPRSCQRADPRSDLDVDLDGCADDVSVDGQLLSVGPSRYLVGQQGDQVVVGSLPCGTAPTVLLLRRVDGSLHVFDEWPAPGTRTTSHRAAEGLSNVQLSIELSPGCREPVITRSDGAREPLAAAIERAAGRSGSPTPPTTSTEENP